MYHERQTRQYCLVHSLNALIGRKEFTPESLDEICYSLNESKWFNPHRSWLGLGNYDANVLMAALSMYNFQVSQAECMSCTEVIASFYNLDSKLQAPTIVENIQEYMEKVIGSVSDKNQIILVTKGSSEQLLFSASR